jgi:protein-tyrosine phosphatase
MKKIRVLFVCLGNICRSPLAEGIFRKKVRERGLDHLIDIDSCGTSNYHIGGPPDSRTLANAKQNGVVIEHAARQLCEADLTNFDYILAMDKSNFSNILRLPGSDQMRSRIKLMREFDPIEKNGEVPDPYHGGEQGFQDVFVILDRTTENFLKHVIETHKIDPARK